MTTTKPAQFSTSRSLFHQTDTPSEGEVVLWGACYDGTTSFRPGTRFGPDAIRAASDGLETYSPEQDLDLEGLAIRDLGNVELYNGSPEPVMRRLRRAVRTSLETPGARFLMMGGEHSLTAAAVEATCLTYPELVVVQLDAHADLRASYLGEKYSHACAMRRCLDVLRPGSLLQVGIRSGTREEFREMRAAGRVLAPTARDLSKALATVRHRPIYLTVDLDVFDPAYMPGTGTPEPGGIDWGTFRDLLDCIPAHLLVAADVMELAPQLDPTGCSSVLAAKVVRELLILMGHHPLDLGDRAAHTL